MTNRQSADNWKRAGLLLGTLAIALLFASAAHAAVSVGDLKARGRLYQIKFNEHLAKKEEEVWNGYLVEKEPVAMRFSDEETIRKRPPSPALPEFSFMSSDYDPYLIERPLPEETIRARERLSEVVIDLDPHTVLSGHIEANSEYANQTPEILNIEEDRGGMLRPDEVLIFFEADSSGNEVKALIPFAPATPSEQTSVSSATYIIEE